MSKSTIKEIAKLAGVSPSAVSIVLNNKPGVSEETRKKVAEIVEKLQYTPNPSSRRLLFNRTGNIAVLFAKEASPLEHFFYAELNQVILHECEARNYNLVFASFTAKNGRVIFPSVIKAYDADGVIFYGDMDPLVLNEVKKFEMPFILVDNHLVTGDVFCVYTDYQEAAYLAACHLIQSGHSRIAYLGSNSPPAFGAQTFAGFKKAMEGYKLFLPLNWVETEANDEASAYRLMDKVLAQVDKPTAVFCAADIYAISAMKCIKAHSLRVPEDISVIGIDDIMLAGYVEPALTTVRINKAEMGKIAVDLLTKRIDKTPVTNAAVPVGDIIVRDSVRGI
ncbi:MAG: LacI family DNA-binding transcriptional regulator [Bacillota bacterium]